MKRPLIGIHLVVWSVHSSILFVVTFQARSWERPMNQHLGIKIQLMKISPSIKQSNKYVKTEFISFFKNDMSEHIKTTEVLKSRLEIVEGFFFSNIHVMIFQLDLLLLLLLSRFSRVRLLMTPWTAAHQAPPSLGFSRQEYWSGVPLPSPGTSPSSL